MYKTRPTFQFERQQVTEHYCGYEGGVTVEEDIFVTILTVDV